MFDYISSMREINRVIETLNVTIERVNLLVEENHENNMNGQHSDIDPFILLLIFTVFMALIIYIVMKLRI